MRLTALLLAVLATATANAAAQCGPDQLNTARTITLKREGAQYGALQHAALPLEKGEVVLTFDDGPSADNTPLVLKALSDQCVKATFFLIGEHIKQQPDLARRLIREGHSAGIHSNTHPHLGTMTPEQQLDDLKLSRAAYKSVFGVEPPAYRFPYLEETPTLLEALKRDNITVASIDMAINDWTPEDTTAILAQRLTESLDKAGRGIILMHDEHAATARALPTLLKVLQDKGYKVVHLEWEAPK
ncbi:peptidoglycan/xylan/chitin deacetylase (PgdA/CDA1 family) [Duganella sp. 1224]|uniref:polysaccharide deacetylase family protein n=1 Tax=Duganella sp. 1224 TaxID=2587052 RepID=UPI0015CA8038|nr:polysaccharide deacetylase family protein [Duganella sp. 1224]NYE59583.1 peptidoglycan/xylan/chitin deacetylase (PgdA/CDA1 family) [Duganella sp. 1224]